VVLSVFGDEVSGLWSSNVGMYCPLFRSYIVKWEHVIYFAFVKEVTWMNYEGSTLLVVTACGVRKHRVRASS